MNTDLNRGPAKIIPFPSRARTTLGELRGVAKPIAKFPLRAVNMASGSSWYHEAAIQDADRTFKN
jgi:hypothetical protein